MNAPDIKKYFNPDQIDSDPAETAEWTEAFQDLLANSDSERAKFILDNLVKLANKNQINWVPN